MLEGVAKEVELEASQPTPEQDIALRSEIIQGVPKNRSLKFFDLEILTERVIFARSEGTFLTRVRRLLNQL